MRVCHNTRRTVFRAPYGAIDLGAQVALSIDIFDPPAPVESVALRCWTEERGEELHPMEAASPTRYSAVFAPEAAGVVWYHFIIALADGSQRRYGAREGCRGGEGALCDWEPPSFQLTVRDPATSLEQDKAEQLAVGRPFCDIFIGFLRGELPAPAFVEAFESLHENCLPEEFIRALDLLGVEQTCSGFVPSRLLERLGGDKGRLWIASLIQLLVGSTPEDGVEDDVVQNAIDLRSMLPLFDSSAPELCAFNDDVVGIWHHSENGEAACLLANVSQHNAHNVSVPFEGESVSEIISGYGVPIVEGDNGAGRFAQVWLGQMGTALLYFHNAQRLERPLEPGLGVLAHITSLPAPAGFERQGTLGAQALAFVDWLAQAGVRYWQILPVNPTDDAGSPYAGISAFAGNVRLLEEYPAFDACDIDQAAYSAFCEREADWLDPYACFMAIRERMGAGTAWQDWPSEYRCYNREAIERDAQLGADAEVWHRGQFIFEQRWQALRAYANERGVQIVGDMPIYVNPNSADAWANPQIFQLGPDGRPQVVAGCPPDQFAVEGQVWGNPVYDWDALAADGYAWWLRRLERAFALYDFVRLDHFIGFARYFSIPSGEKASEGAYHPGPGLALFETAHDAFGPLPIIAEDLGLITPSVRALVAACGFPGMDIVQFIDGGDPLTGYMPRPEKIVYTGTHDNQTLVGFCEQRYPELDAHEAADRLIASAIACNAPVVVLPLQDVLGLGDEARMNTPGTVGGNWSWQADASAIAAARAHLEAMAQARTGKPADFTSSSE